MRYINLDRRFALLPPEKVECGLDWSRETGRLFSWADLLQQSWPRLTVILGPGDSGKTTEMREQARRLRATGQTAVFAALKDLVGQPFERALTGDEAAAFRAWDPAYGEAVFLLDAVNEANLTHALPQALRTFAAAVGHSKGRVRVLLSCRPSDWLNQTRDEVVEALSDLFSTPPASGTETTAGFAASLYALGPVAPLTVTTVCLMPLDEDGIRCMAAAVLGTPDAFLAALVATGCLHLAGRPRDVTTLARHWRDKQVDAANVHKQLTRMLDENVDAKLREDKKPYSSLNPHSANQARQGAERLAGATALCRQPFLRLDRSLDLDCTALEPTDALPDWLDSDVAALLARSLFDAAPGGRMRFHHESTRAYLAGRWLLGLLEARCPVPRVVDVLSRDVFGRRHVAASLKEVAGWVGCQHTGVRAKLIAFAPELVLLWGDAQLVPASERAVALRRLAEVHRDAVQPRWPTGDDVLTRLYDPQLIGTVQDLLAKPERMVAVRRLLLNLVRVGGIKVAGEAALGHALDPTQNLQVRLAAVDAVGAVGGDFQRTRLWAYARETAPLPDAFLVRVGTALLPKAWSTSDAAAILSKLTATSFGRESPIEIVTRQWIDACPPGERLALLGALIDLIVGAPHTSRRPRGRDTATWERRWLMPALIRVATLETERHVNSSGGPSPILIHALLMVSSCDRWAWSRWRKALEAALVVNDRVRRAFHVAVLLTAPADQAKLRLRVLLHWTRPEDADELLHRVAEPTTVEQRQRLLSGACHIRSIHDPDAGLTDRIRHAISSAGLPDAQTTKLLKELEQPTRTEEKARQNKEFEEKSQRQAENEAAFRSMQRSQWAKDLDAIRRGDAQEVLYHLTCKMKPVHGGEERRLGVSNIELLKSLFGAELVDATRAGLLWCWPRWCPPLPSDAKGEWDFTRLQLGLSGLAIYAAQGGDFANLSDEEARIATHYALYEQGGLPDWFGELSSTKPTVVAPLLLRELHGILAGESVENRSTVLLERIAAVEPAARLVAGDILSMLRQHLTTLERRGPDGRRSIIASLAIARHVTDVDASGLADLCVERTAHLWTGRPDWEMRQAWLQAWFHSDFETAWRFVDDRLSAAPAAAPNLVVMILAGWRGDPTVGDYPDRVQEWRKILHRPARIASFLQTVYRHLPPRTDPDFERAYPFSVEVAAAIEVRNAVSDWLEAIEGFDAHRALAWLARDAGLGEDGLTFLDALQRHSEAAAEAETDVWTPRQVAQFSNEHECDPRTPDDLFRLTCSRLEAIRDNIEDGDFSDRGIFPAKEPEVFLQRYFAGRLERESDGRYSVAREPEVADNKKPDIRIYGKIKGIVSIEIKPLGRDGYSLAKLKDALETQLVGQYMRAVDSRHGILLLCMIESRRWEIEKPDGTIDRSAGLSDLLKVLNDAAADLVAGRPDIDGLTVIGIDATPWEKAGKASKTNEAKAPAKPGGRAKVKTAAPAEGT